MSDPTPLMEEALNLYQSQDFAGAAQRYREVVEEDPKHWEAWRMLGFSLNAAGDYEKAAEAFKQAVNINNQDADNHFGLGLALQASGDHKAAIVAFENALEVNSQHPAVKPKLAESYAARGDDMLETSNLFGAEQFYEKAYKYSQSDEHYHKLIEYYEKAGQDHKASMLNRERASRFGAASTTDTDLRDEEASAPPAIDQTQVFDPVVPENQATNPTSSPGQVNPSQPGPTGTLSAPTSAPDPQPAQPAFSPCPKCTKPMSTTAILCPHCGWDKRKSQAGYVDHKAQAMKKTWQETTFRVLVIIYLVTALLGLVGGIITGQYSALIFNGIAAFIHFSVLQEQTWAFWVSYIVTVLNIVFHGALLVGLGLTTMVINPIVGVLVILFFGAFLALDILYLYLLKYNGDLV